MTQSVSNVNGIIPPAEAIAAANEPKRYKDIAERKDYISDENGINYLKYLDSENNGSCWYYKSKLFWTWLLYYFCFCGNRSVCKCYICLCKFRVCRKRIKSRNHVMKFLFAAAKKVQYNRYYKRYQADTFNYILNHAMSKPTTPDHKAGISPRQSINFHHDDSHENINIHRNTATNLDRGILNFSHSSMEDENQVELEVNLR